MAAGGWRRCASAVVSVQSLGCCPQHSSSGISESLGGGGRKHHRCCQPVRAPRAVTAMRGFLWLQGLGEGRDKALRSQAGSRLLAQRQAQHHSTPLQAAPGGASESASVLSPPDPHTSRHTLIAKGSRNSQVWRHRSDLGTAGRGNPWCCSQAGAASQPGQRQTPPQMSPA